MNYSVHDVVRAYRALKRYGVASRVYKVAYERLGSVERVVLAQTAVAKRLEVC